MQKYNMHDSIVTLICISRIRPFFFFFFYSVDVEKSKKRRLQIFILISRVRTIYGKTGAGNGY